MGQLAKEFDMEGINAGACVRQTPRKTQRTEWGFLLVCFIIEGLSYLLNLFERQRLQREDPKGHNGLGLGRAKPGAYS